VKDCPEQTVVGSGVQVEGAFVPIADCVPQELVWKNEVPEQTVETSGDQAPPEFVPVAVLVVPQLLVCVKDAPEQTVTGSGDQVEGTQDLLAVQDAVDPPLNPAQVQFHEPEPVTAEAVPALQRLEDGALAKV
jgi:hypothetical protein